MSFNSLVIVSGATKGIGRAIAEKFASEGFDLVVCARSLDELKQFKIDVENKSKVNCHIFQADVSQKEQVMAFGQFILDLNQQIKVLVNNAGVFMPGKLLEESDGNLETMLDTNLYSAYYLSRSLLPVVIKSEHPAHVFNICSIASLLAYPQSGSYSISKFAMLGFSKSLREELKVTKIKVTSVMPGATFTSSWAGVDIPEDHFMIPKDVADIIWATFNLSPQAVVEELTLRPLKGDI